MGKVELVKIIIIYLNDNIWLWMWLKSKKLDRSSH